MGNLSNRYRQNRFKMYDLGGPMSPAARDYLLGRNAGGYEANMPKGPTNGAGGFAPTKASSLVGGVAPMVGSLVDAMDSGNKYGRQKTGTQAVKGALNGAAAGAAGGPIGMAAGAVIGGVAGLITGGKQRKAEASMIQGDKIRNQQMEDNYMAGQLANNPELYQGSRYGEYFEEGGRLAGKYKRAVEGGSLNQHSSDGMEVVGNSHEQGGVQLPEAGAEVEGKETIKGDYVFSDKLGFAKLHKPIMKAKGIIEGKPATSERINSIKLLEKQEEKLMMSQEYIKSLTTKQ